MGNILQILVFILIGLLLLWFGFNLFFAGPGLLSLSVAGRARRGRQPRAEGIPGMPRTCPVCSARLERGERVKSAAFPSFNGQERLMHISGCEYCLEGDRARICPVCGAVLRDEEYLVARLYEKSRLPAGTARAHVHVLGCSRCKKVSRSY